MLQKEKKKSKDYVVDGYMLNESPTLRYTCIQTPSNANYGVQLIQDTTKHNTIQSAQ